MKENFIFVLLFFYSSQLIKGEKKTSHHRSTCISIETAREKNARREE